MAGFIIKPNVLTFKIGYMREERELSELVEHLKEIPKYETLKQFELLFDVEPFLMHFLTSTDYTKLLKITDRTTMKYKHLDGYTPLMMIVVNPNITNFEKTVVIDRLIEMGCDVNRPNDFGETALMMAVKRNNRKMMEYLLENGANPNISDNLGVTPLMIATFNSQLYNMAVLHFFNAQLGATCSSYELDVFDIAKYVKGYKGDWWYFFEKTGHFPTPISTDYKLERPTKMKIESN